MEKAEEAGEEQEVHEAAGSLAGPPSLYSFT